jgi:hypothetical protein
MYISDSEETLRYTVDGGIEYVCQLRINLGPLYNDPVGRVTSRPYIGMGFPCIRVPGIGWLRYCLIRCRFHDRLHV